MNKQNQILTVVLVVQLALATAIFWPRAVASGAESGPLLANFKAAEVVGLSISDADGNQVTLTKSGDTWVLPQADDFPADGTRITPLLDKIEAIKTNRLVTRTEASQKRLKVADGDFNRRLELTLSDGSSHTLYLGSSAGASATHVRADTASEVFLTGDLTAFDANAQASAWIDTLFFSLPVTATVSLTLANQNGTFEFEQQGETWTMKGLAGDETLKEGEVTRLVDLAGAVRMTEPIGKVEQPDFGLAEPLATVTLKTADKTYVLKVGAKDEQDSSYVMSSSESPYFVRVAQFTGDSFVTPTRDSFLEPPPTAEPEGAGGSSGS
ncbi:MAG: DUF4340 domain-containing protein [Chloroflexota bacterium]